MSRPKKEPEVSRRVPRRPPATTPEQRERQLIAQATDLAEKQIRQGTASATVIVHYLKLATSKERLENDLLRAKVEQLESARNVEQLYSDALKAMRAYSGQIDEEEDAYFDY